MTAPMSGGAQLEAFQESAAHGPTRRLGYRDVWHVKNGAVEPARIFRGDEPRWCGCRPVRMALAFVVAIAAMMLFSVSMTNSASAAPKTGSVTTPRGPD